MIKREWELKISVMREREREKEVDLPRHVRCLHLWKWKPFYFKFNTIIDKDHGLAISLTDTHACIHKYAFWSYLPIQPFYIQYDCVLNIERFCKYLSDDIATTFVGFANKRFLFCLRVLGPFCSYLSRVCKKKFTLRAILVVFR